MNIHVSLQISLESKPLVAYIAFIFFCICMCQHVVAQVGGQLKLLAAGWAFETVFISNLK